MFNKIQNIFKVWEQKHISMHVPYPTLHELNCRRLDRAPPGMVVGFYTKDTFYEKEKDRLVKSANALNLKINTTSIDSTGSWVKNASLKSSFLVAQRKIFKGPLLYVDVDAVFHRDPWEYLQNIKTDIAVYYQHDGHLIGATILINDTPNALELLQQWEIQCKANPEKWDQVVLEEILAQDSAQEKYSVERLPVSFCWIFDRVENETSDKIYIEQLQASRQATQKKGFFRKIRRKLKRRWDRVLEIENQLNIDNV